MPSYIDQKGGIINSFNINQNYIKTGKYGGNIIYEFPSSFTVDTGNLLSSEGSGISVHKEKAISMSLGVVDREGLQLSSSTQIYDNPFVKSLSIDILSEYNEIVYKDYKKDSFSSQFVFSEEENISVFGQYQENFGVAINIKDAASERVHSNRYFVYGNSLEIKKINIHDSQGYWVNEYPIFSNSNVTNNQKGNQINVTGLTGVVSFEVYLENDPRYTNFKSVDVYLGLNKSLDLSNGQIIKTIDLSSNSQSNSFDLDSSKLTRNQDYYFLFVPQSTIKQGNPWLVGPYSLYEAPIPQRVDSFQIINIKNGEKTFQMQLLTGVIYSGDFYNPTGFVLDINDYDDGYTVYEYKTSLFSQSYTSYYYSTLAKGVSGKTLNSVAYTSSSIKNTWKAGIDWTANENATYAYMKLMFNQTSTNLDVSKFNFMLSGYPTGNNRIYESLMFPMYYRIEKNSL